MYRGMGVSAAAVGLQTIIMSVPSASPPTAPPTAPTSLLARHTLPPEEWGSGQRRGGGGGLLEGITGQRDGGAVRRSGNASPGAVGLTQPPSPAARASLCRKRKRPPLPRRTSARLRCRREVLIWQRAPQCRRDLQLTLWDIPAGAVGRTPAVLAHVQPPFSHKVNPCIGKNKTRFDIVWRWETGGGKARPVVHG